MIISLNEEYNYALLRCELWSRLIIKFVDFFQIIDLESKLAEAIR